MQLAYVMVHYPFPLICFSLVSGFIRLIPASLSVFVWVAKSITSNYDRGSSGSIPQRTRRART